MTDRLDYELTDQQKACSHDEFAASCEVVRLKDDATGIVDSWALNVRVSCVRCGLGFGFYGPPAGLHYFAPTTSPDGLELRAPIAPGPIPRTGPALYQVGHTSTGTMS